MACISLLQLDVTRIFLGSFLNFSRIFFDVEALEWHCER